MGLLGILTCEILELEFAYLLGTDPAVSQITVLEDARSARLIEALDSGGFQNVRRIPHIKDFFPEPSEHLEVLVRVLELALHRSKETLQRGLVGAAREMSRHVDALLLGYGLCGSALEDPEELLDVEVPVFVPIDGDHPVDDCVGLILGGRDRYYAEQCQVPGTFFMTPGWSRHWKRLFGQNFGDVEREAAKRLFAHYERTLLIMTPVMPQDEMKQRAHAFSRLLGLRVQEREGTLDILSQALQTAKAFLERKAIKTGINGS
ncbi:MAG: DUF1638 domain-containing protein [Desulfobacteraceae bacterium]|jgi:hypothetical protein